MNDELNLNEIKQWLIDNYKYLDDEIIIDFNNWIKELENKL